jgi:hypothetical protein
MADVNWQLARNLLATVIHRHARVVAVLKARAGNSRFMRALTRGCPRALTRVCILVAHINASLCMRAQTRSQPLVEGAVLCDVVEQPDVLIHGLGQSA